MSSKKGSLVYETECQQAFFAVEAVYTKGAFQKHREISIIAMPVPSQKKNKKKKQLRE